jgi:pimeloyl-ACP methyl ester carboxylesterase
VTFGSSVGGGNALAAAADDPRVAAAISQVPFLDMSQAPLSPQVREEIQAVAAKGGHLPAVGQPHEAAFINAPGAEVGWRRVVANGDESRWRNRVSTAWLMGAPYRPSQQAGTLHCPWLVCVAANDGVALPGPAIDAALRAPKGELCLYPEIDHFDIYDGPPHEAVVADELEFLYRHLLGRSLLGAPKVATVTPRIRLKAGQAAVLNGHQT